MIISRTPFRISFTGGSTDLKSFYENEFGAVVSTTINKYIYITVNKRFDHTIRASYSKTEIVESADEIAHPIIREALKLTGIKNGLEITSIADIPAGTGLGSSSSFTVGLLHALYAYSGKYVSAKDLAIQACNIEINILKEPIGKQDQYAAAFGGLNLIRFNVDDSVFVDPVVMSRDRHRELSQNFLLFFTGIQRSASNILKKTENRQIENKPFKSQMRDMSLELSEKLRSGESLNIIGDFLHRGWELKRQLSNEISNEFIDSCYAKALEAGAMGGKILGAGGGGFLCLYATKDKHASIRKALADLREIDFEFDYQGSKIVYVE
ncbi:MAG: GHMP kinase [Fibrobacteres bacterium]|nr:GHMP kinase [Fibrobacterota bacterium]